MQTSIQQSALSPQHQLAASQAASSESLSETKRPFVSVVISAFNESLIIQRNLQIICAYLRSIEASYRWEIILVNDGSKDNTGLLADRFAEHNDYNLLVIHHPIKKGLVKR